MWKSIIILTMFGILNLNTLISNEMFKFIPNSDGTGTFKQSEFLKGNKIFKMYKDNSFNIFEYDNNDLNKFSPDEFDDELNEFSDMYNFKNRLLLSSGNNSLFEYEEGEWNQYQYEDNYNNKDALKMRRINKITEFESKVYCLSYSYDLLFIDTSTSGQISYIVDTTYNEIFSLNDKTLELEFRSNASLDGKFIDFTADEDYIWILSDILYKYKNNLVDSFDIANKLGLEKGNKFSKIATNGEFVYLLKSFSPSATENRSSALIRFHKKTFDVEMFDFPIHKSFDSSNSDIEPKSINNMEFINGIGYISTDIGLYKFQESKLEYYDVFSEFIDKIPKVFLPYLETSDICIDGTSIAISTNVGLIYTDTYSSINVVSDEINIRIFPNILNRSQNVINLDANIDLPISKIVIFNINGSKVYESKKISVLNKGISSLNISDLSSGHYYFSIITNEESFIYPIIINN